jgi:hypothetical protein
MYIHGQLFGTTYRVTGGYRYRPGQASWRGLLEEFYNKYLGFSKKPAKTFYSIFFTKRQLKVVKTISAHSKGTVSILRTFKKIFIVWH